MTYREPGQFETMPSSMLILLCFGFGPRMRWQTRAFNPTTQEWIGQNPVPACWTSCSLAESPANEPLANLKTAFPLASTPMNFPSFMTAVPAPSKACVTARPPTVRVTPTAEIHVPLGPVHSETNVPKCEAPLITPSTPVQKYSD